MAGDAGCAAGRGTVWDEDVGWKTGAHDAGDSARAPAPPSSPRAFKEGRPPRRDGAGDERPGAEDPDEDVDVIDDPAPKRSERLLCRQCGQVMTSRESVIEIDGASDHVFENPHGMVYHVRCFGEAPGAVTLGAPTNDFTWFRGYTWQIALCGGCRSHVGWAFIADKHRFWGLIPGRLVAEAE
jgi:hypothetical protein